MTNPTPEAVAALVNALRTKSAMINMGEKIAWGSETALMDQAADMLTALARRQMVKPLVWTKGLLGYTAKSPFGDYRVSAGNYTNKWVWENPESELTGWHGLVPDEDAAKAAAQADYEARILSALEPDPTGGWCSDMEAARVLLAALAKKTAHSQRDEFSRVGHSINEASWHVHLAGFRSQDEALAFLDAALRAIAEGK